MSTLNIAAFERDFAPPADEAAEINPFLEFGLDEAALNDVGHPWSWEDAMSHPKLVQRRGEPFILKETRDGQKMTGLNAQYWMARFAAETLILFEPHARQFFTYEQGTGVWIWSTDEVVQSRVAEYLLGYSRRLKVPLLETARTAKVLSPMVDALRATAERREPFQKGEAVIHLANGMLDLGVAPPVLRRFSPRYFSLCASPVGFDAAAICPRFLNELLHSALEPADAVLLRYFCGLFLLGRNVLQVMLLLVGIGGAGKGTIERVIAGIIGGKNIKQLRTKHLEGRFELDDLESSSLLVGSDVSGDFLSFSGAKVIKALTGGDPLTMESKGGRKREVRGEHNILITCNDRLQVNLDGDESAWKRRLHILEFSKTPPQTPIADFSRILLREEASGILNWMILGAVDVMEIVRKGGGLPATAKQNQVVENLLAESSSLRLFVGRSLVCDPEGSVTAEELQTEYENFTADLGWVALSKNQVERQLGRLMMEFYHAAKRHDINRGDKQKRGYKGVALNTTPAKQQL